MSEHTTRENRQTGSESTPLERLEAARERLTRARRRIEEGGGGAVEDAAEAYRRARKLLDTYVDRATGTGRENFKAYVQLEGQFAALVENVPEEIDGPFRTALDAIDKRRLHESDFERAETALEPAREHVDLIEEREAAREALSEARTAARERLRELDDEIARHERLLEFADADVDAPVERLREPIEAYNGAIGEAFARYRREVSARELFAFLERTRWYPFVGYEAPSADLETYVREDPAGEYSIAELLEYADYSRSKLAHYVDDADELKRRIATERTYLDGIDAGPLQIPWPPEPAGVLRRRARELVPLVARVVDGGGVSTEEPGEGDANPVAMVRAIRRLTDEDDYERLRTAAVAAARTTADERRRLATGRVEADLERLRTEREDLETALEASESA